MRIIKYIPKITNARTEYREITNEDAVWLQTELIRWLTVMSQLDQCRDDDSVWVRDHWWHRRTNKLHKGQEGPNTPCSLVGGVLNNLLFKEPQQRDFTNKQMEDIEYVSAILAQAYPTITAVRFQIGFQDH